jgi:hypothetical protein
MSMSSPWIDPVVSPSIPDEDIWDDEDEDDDDI